MLADPAQYRPLTTQLATKGIRVVNFIISLIHFLQLA
jgi:hypothetical protein